MNVVCSYLHEVLRVKFIKRESRIEVSGAEGRREWELLVNGYRVSVWDDKELDGGGGYTPM